MRHPFCNQLKSVNSLRSQEIYLGKGYGSTGTGLEWLSFSSTGCWEERGHQPFNLQPAPLLASWHSCCWSGFVSMLFFLPASPEASAPSAEALGSIMVWCFAGKSWAHWHQSIRQAMMSSLGVVQKFHPLLVVPYWTGSSSVLLAAVPETFFGSGFAV